jgi:hypothetical protein
MLQALELPPYLQPAACRLQLSLLLFYQYVNELLDGLFSSSLLSERLVLTPAICIRQRR